MTSYTPELRLGTRGSVLARAQADSVRAALFLPCEIVVITTSGDRIKDRPLGEAGGKGLFTKEIDEALLSGKIDLAVHSAKDMPTRAPVGLVIAACLPRQDVRDVLIAREPVSLDRLPQGAQIGTSALRRRAQLLVRRPDLRIEDMRGNVDTRLRKLAAGACDAIVLAAAGLARLGITPPHMRVLSPDEMLPAVGQGAIAIVARADDSPTLALLSSIDHARTRHAVEAERAFLDGLNGSCRSPLAGHAEFDDDRVRFQGLALSPDGTEHYAVQREGPAGDAIALARDAAADIRGGASPRFRQLYLSGE